MYLRGNKWSMNRRPSRRANLWRILLLLGLIGGALYVNQVVVPATPPLFMPTPTLTQSPESFVNQAEELASDGKLSLAIDAYKRGIEADPTNAANFVALARLQVFAGEYEDAVQSAQNAMLNNPNYADAHAVLGWALGFQEKYGEAEREIQQALGLEPSNALAHAYFAEILINQNNYELFDQAIEESKRARDLDPSLLETHRARGIVLLNTQNVEEAVQEFQAALAINKNIADLYLNMGVAYRLLEKYDLAQEALLAGYALNPTDPIALIELSRAFFADGRYVQAAQYAEEAIKVDPGNPRLFGNAGVVYYKLEEYTKAVESLGLAVRGGTTADGQAVNGLPLDYGRIEEYYWYYGFALVRLNRCGEAIPVFQALLTGVPDSEYAFYNATEGLAACQELAGTPRPEATEEVTPTP